jgi:hypothetical protein
VSAWSICVFDSIIKKRKANTQAVKGARVNAERMAKGMGAGQSRVG